MYIWCVDEWCMLCVCGGGGRVTVAACSSPRLRAAVARLRGCGCVAAIADAAPFELTCDDDSLWLARRTLNARDGGGDRRGVRAGRAAAPVARPHRVDFSSTTYGIGSGNVSRRRQPLARALGACRTIVDATAGWGRDSVTAALMGYDVLALERCAVVHAMLEDGLHRATTTDPTRAAALGGRLRFERCNSVARLRTGFAADEKQPEAVLIDPMWREASGFAKARRKHTSALPRAPLQLLSALLADDDDSSSTQDDDDAAVRLHDATPDALIEAALRCEGVRRVVLKKPRAAAPLVVPSGARQLDVVEANLVRFDVLVRKQQTKKEMPR